ncbi:MAG: imidazole glycerol phosphate synthase cyclase subunit [Candidatus Omnitrophica bacterium]|nr:imidazole glycerol phosphate synthase cyclase subunit [Candidatus Omnitrophota bacterium]
MLRKRLITVLQFNNGVLFRTKHFIPDYRYTLNFVDAWSVDEIVMLDITRPGERNRRLFLDIVEDFVKRCFVPIAAGGGVRSIEDFQEFLNAGADKVIINTQAVETPDFITKAAKLYGSQCVVVSIDAKKLDSGEYEVFTHCGSQSTGLQPQIWAKIAEDLGAGEIMVTSVERDGSLEGYDNILNAMLAQSVNIPVLVNGGAGKWQDFVDGIVEGHASAVCTSNIYHFTDSSIRSAKEYLKNAQIPTRE